MGQPDQATVLLVDDEPRNLLALEATLASVDCRLVTASSGFRALECLLHEDFAAILLDIHMAGMDGFETASLIRARDRSQSTPIIFLTADDRRGARVREAYRLGAVDYMYKPFDPDILRSKVTIFVDLFRKTAALVERTVELTRVSADLALRERQLEALNAQLEERVVLRTAALQAAVRDLERTAIERERAEKALRDSETLHRTLARNFPNGTVLLYDLDLRFQIADGSSLADMGFTSAMLEGRTIWEVFPADACLTMEPHFRAALAGEPSLLQMQFRGNVHSSQATPVRNEAGEIVGGMIMTQDMTEWTHAESALRDSELRLQTVISNAPVVLFAVDRQGTFTLFDGQALKALGQAPGHFVGESALIAHTGALDVSAEIRRALTGESFTHSMEYCGRLFDAYFSPVLSSDETVVGAIGVAVDMSDRRAMDKMKDDFISVVSHEMRTPLTSIRGSLGLLSSGLLATAPERAQRMITIASTNADRLIRLIKDILDVERMQSGLVALEKSDCDPADVLERALEAMRPVADAAGVRLEHVRNATTTPLPLVSMDADRILQTLTNLIDNAIKFTPTDTTVTIGAERVDRKLVVRVADKGRGIPTDKLSLIFERFQQVDGSDAREKGGTGLGLAICRSIVQQHGGAIWVESRVGRGSTFLFTLPLRSVTATSAVALPRISVLVCDDEPAVVQETARVLRGAGFNVVTAGSGVEAVRQALTHSPNVILLDLIMPGMDGLQTVEALRTHVDTRLTPIIIMTGLPGGTSGLSRDDVSEWIVKPVDPDELRKTVARIVARSNASPRVLLAEHDAELAEVLAVGLRQRGVEVLHARSGRQAIDLCGVTAPDLLIVDVDLPDDDAVSVIGALREQAGSRGLPTIIYTSRELDEPQRTRLRLGPTEFLTRRDADGGAVERTVLELLHLPHARANQPAA